MDELVEWILQLVVSLGVACFTWYLVREKNDDAD